MTRRAAGRATLEASEKEQSMKVIALTTKTREMAEFALGSLHDGVEKERFAVDDVALVSKDTSGVPDYHRHHHWLHREAIAAELAQQAAGLIGPGEAAVLVCGADATMDQIGSRARELDLGSYELGSDGPHEMTGGRPSVEPIGENADLLDMSDEIPMPEHMLFRVDYS